MVLFYNLNIWPNYFQRKFYYLLIGKSGVTLVHSFDETPKCNHIILGTKINTLNVSVVHSSQQLQSKPI